MTSTHLPDKQEQEQIQQMLDLQMQEVTFEQQHRVIRQTHPNSITSRLHALWNYEFEFSLKPMRIIGGLGAVAVISTVCLMLQQPAVLEQSNVSFDGDRKLIKIANNIYWQDAYEQVVKKHEN